MTVKQVGDWIQSAVRRLGGTLSGPPAFSRLHRKNRSLRFRFELCRGLDKTSGPAVKAPEAAQTYVQGFVAIENFVDHLQQLHRHTFRKQSLCRNIAAVARTLPSTSGLGLQSRSSSRSACASSKKQKISVFFQHSESVHDIFKFVPLSSVSAVCQSTCF